MTEQEVFDIAVTGLLKQAARSNANVGTEDEVCAYRGDNGMKCAVGFLIEDSEYSPEMEGEGVRGLKGRDLLPVRLQDERTVRLLVELQAIHDSFPLIQWLPKLKKLAERLRLTWNMGHLEDEFNEKVRKTDGI